MGPPTQRSTPLPSALTPPSPDEFDLIAHLGKQRFAPYLDECQDDVDLATQAYSWNMELGAAFWTDLGYVEVAMRNAIDATIRDREGDDWIEDPKGKFGRSDTRRHGQPYSGLLEARSRVDNQKKQLSRDQIISETSFGVWRSLLSRQYKNYWPNLAKAFPGSPTRDWATVQNPVNKIGALRNRIAHHHRIGHQNYPNHHRELLLLAEYISPKLKTWIVGTSRVQSVIERRPH